MTQYIDAIWKVFTELAKPYTSMADIKEKNNAYDEFKSTFNELYEYAKNNYMNAKVENLDLHKTAAITAVSICIVQPLECDKKLGEKFFVLNEILAISTALSSLQYFLNERLDKFENKRIEKISLMETINCKDDFSFILSRNLFFHRKDRTLSEAEPFLKDSILDLAAVFYMLEYITLKENEIDLEKFKTITGAE